MLNQAMYFLETSSIRYYFNSDFIRNKLKPKINFKIFITLVINYKFTIIITFTSNYL